MIKSRRSVKMLNLKANCCRLMLACFYSLLFIFFLRRQFSANEKTPNTVTNVRNKSAEFWPLVDITPAFTADDPDFFQNHFKSSSNKVMFFVVTTGSTEMSARQTCAIESTCVHNPSWTVVVVFVLPALVVKVEEGAPLVGVVRRWPNVHLATVNAMAAMVAAGLGGLAQQIAQGNYPVQHSSSVLRVLLLQRFGGVYGDLDLVMLRSLQSTVPHENFMVGAARAKFASCFFGLRRNHPIAVRILSEMQKDYGSIVYSFSPEKFTTVIKQFCKKSPELVLKNQKCDKTDLAIFNSTLIGPYEFRDYKNYFIDVTKEIYDRESKNSIVFHVFNKLSASNKKLTVNSNSLYVRAARNFCPVSIATF